MITRGFLPGFAAIGTFIALGIIDLSRPIAAQTFRQQYEERIDTENRAKEARLRYLLEPFLNASICFTVKSYGYDGGASPIVCNTNNGSWFISYGVAPKGEFRGSTYGQNGYAFAQFTYANTVREDIAARLTIIDENTFRVQYGSNACKYSPVLECQLSDKKCFSSEGPAGSISIVSKDAIISLFK